MTDIMASLSSLTPAEKLELIGQLWDDLSASPDEIPLLDWQLQELDRRKAEFEANPASRMTWDEVKQKIKGRHGG